MDQRWRTWGIRALTLVGRLVTLISPAANVFDGDQVVGVALGKVDGKRRLLYNATASTSTPSSSVSGVDRHPNNLVALHV